jgi:hypothetical protein
MSTNNIDLNCKQHCLIFASVARNEFKFQFFKVFDRCLNRGGFFEMKQVLVGAFITSLRLYLSTVRRP